jgi:hypothetical protein
MGSLYFCLSDITISEYHFSILSGFLPVLTHLFSVCEAGYFKTWDSTGYLA